MNGHKEIRAANRHLILRKHKGNIFQFLVAEKVELQS